MLELGVERNRGNLPSWHPFDMRWLLNLLKSLFSSRPQKTGRAELLGMYLGESNHTGRRKSNRDRA
jgi:hypothetical protein